jgi:hypothetical protein
VATEERTAKAPPAEKEHRAGAGELVERPSLRSLVEDLEERRAKAKLGGGEERIARQHDQD